MSCSRMCRYVELQRAADAAAANLQLIDRHKTIERHLCKDVARNCLQQANSVKPPGVLPLRMLTPQLLIQVSVMKHMHTKISASVWACVSGSLCVCVLQKMAMGRI